MTKVAYPSMRDHRYADTLAVGVIASSGTLGFLIPPFDQHPELDTLSPTWSPMTSPKKPLRSSLIHEGLDRVPHRAFLRAVGMADEDFGKPMVAVVSQHGENTPCSMSLGPQADAARLVAATCAQEQAG